MSLHSVLPTDVVFRMVQYIVDKSVARSLSPTFCKFFDQSILELTIGTSSDLDLLESNVYCPSLNALKHRLSGCKHLQKLVIHSTPFIDNEFIKWIHSTLTTLVWFEIVQCSKVTSSANEIYANNAKPWHCILHQSKNCIIILTQLMCRSHQQQSNGGLMISRRRL